MSLSARRACVWFLMVVCGLAAPGLNRTRANRVTAAMQVTVNVVRSCSVQTPATTAVSSIPVTVACQRGSADVVSIGAGAGRDTTVRPLADGANRLSVDRGASARGEARTVTVTVEF